MADGMDERGDGQEEEREREIGEEDKEVDDDMQPEPGFSLPAPEGTKRKDAVSKITIGGQTITIPARLAGLPETVIVDAAKAAMSRLQTMAAVHGGFVVILSLSHTAILGKIEGGKVRGTPQQKEVLRQILTNGTINRDPDAIGLRLTSIECFKPPPGMNLHKLNFAGVGAISCVDETGDSKVQINESSYYFIIHQIILGCLAVDGDFHSKSKNIISEIQSTFTPVLKENAASRVKELGAVVGRIKDSHGIAKAKSNTKAKSNAKDKVPMEKISRCSTQLFQDLNLRLGLGLSSHHVTDSTCIFNKKYLRIGKNSQEHYPALDWHVTVFDNTGTILVGNIFDPNPGRPGGLSTQIPPNAYDYLGDSWMPDCSWMMDLITVIKIIKHIDIVTTKDILQVLYENGITNVIFIDGGCNEFRDDDRKIMIPCGPNDDCLSLQCDSCSELPPKHPTGGGGAMTNKKLKKTKKKARIVRTVRGRRMRKSYKRYKRYKTYKRSKTYKR